jgi:NAD+ synthase (glutamine-hydrolysing)
MRLTSFDDCADAHRGRLGGLRHIALEAAPPASEMPLRRIIDRFPYVPSDPETRSERCLETYDIQVQGLAKRLEATGIERAVIGVSGGVDSAQALLVTTRAFDRLSLPRQRAGGHDAGLCDVRGNSAGRLGPDAGSRRQRIGDRYPTVGATDA